MKAPYIYAYTLEIYLYKSSAYCLLLKMVAKTILILNYSSLLLNCHVKFMQNLSRYFTNQISL